MTVKRKPLLLAFAGLVPFLVFWWLYTPSYVELYIPVPSYEADIWNHTSRATLSYARDSGVTYVLRRGGTAYADVVGWQSEADGLSYLDRWLTERGWERTEMYTEGDPALPESSFLKFGQSFAVYTRPDDRSGFNGNARGAMGRVTVAVWPIEQANEAAECRVQGFNVVVVTAKPSFWKAITDSLDD
jgi:hypothetical protein